MDWRVDQVDPAAKKIILTPSGTATLPTMVPTCDVQPYTHAIAPADGHLDLDFSTNLTGTCPANPNDSSGHGGVWWDLLHVPMTPLPFQPGQRLKGTNDLSTWDFPPVTPSP